MAGLDLDWGALGQMFGSKIKQQRRKKRWKPEDYYSMYGGKPKVSPVVQALQERYRSSGWGLADAEEPSYGLPGRKKRLSIGGLLQLPPLR